MKQLKKHPGNTKVSVRPRCVPAVLVRCSRWRVKQGCRPKSEKSKNTSRVLLGKETTHKHKYRINGVFIFLGRSQDMSRVQQGTRDAGLAKIAKRPFDILPVYTGSGTTEHHREHRASPAALGNTGTPGTTNTTGTAGTTVATGHHQVSTLSISTGHQCRDTQPQDTRSRT